MKCARCGGPARGHAVWLRVCARASFARAPGPIRSGLVCVFERGMPAADPVLTKLELDARRSRRARDHYDLAAAEQGINLVDRGKRVIEPAGQRGLRQSAD